MPDRTTRPDEPPGGSTGLASERLAPDEAATIARCITFLKEATLRRTPAGPVRRFNQGRNAGCVDGEFQVLEGLPAALRVGLFAEPRTYQAFIRFASASSESDREKDVRGMSISVAGVQERNLTEGATTQDFVLNSHPVMAARDTGEFLELLQALEAGGLRQVRYFLTHPRSARIGMASRGQPTSHLDIPYWSTTPYLFGAGRAVKYIVQPRSEHRSTLPSPLTDTYLRDALQRHLEQAEGVFDFLVQFQTDSGRMPIEDASVEWSPGESPYVPVARIRIPRQRVEDEARLLACEAVAFNPWHALAEHRPLGNMNRARREIYPALAGFRRERAGAAVIQTSGRP